MAQSETYTVTSKDQEAIDRLVELEAEQAKEIGLESKPEPKDDLNEQADQAAKPEKVEENADSEPAGIPSEAEEVKADKQEEKPVKEQPVTLTDDDKKKFAAFLKQTQSKYSADLGKKLVRWDAIKQQESAIQSAKAEQEKAYQAKLAQLNAEMEQFKAEQESTRPTPEKYVEFAEKLQGQIAIKEAEAIKAEAEGDFDKAEALKQEVIVLKEDVKRANNAAEHIRKNPPVNLQKQQERFVEYQKTWIDKAAVDFPEFAKKDSAVQREAAEFYKQMTASDPSVAKLPGFIYFCAERATLKSAADRVPAMVKELTSLKTKLKEYEALTSPTPAAGVARAPKGEKPLSDMSQDELYESLRAEASMLRK
jgi:hypothetical protein